MNYFKNYSSNTLAGSGNQTFFITNDKEEIIKSRTLYKVFTGGEYNYSFLFSNIIDSTYSDGSHSSKNLVIDEWTITEARVGITDFCSMEEIAEPKCMYNLTFDGNTTKKVKPGEIFYTDKIKLAPKKHEYICLEISFFGENIPYHEESIIPSFIFSKSKWIPSKLHPFAGMIGCDRPISARIAFLGDSITQGIGVSGNSYAHWNALVAEMLGDKYSYWNLGLGYGRADDAASDGAWLFKAKQNDIVFLCYGVNDILQGFDEENIKANLNAIIEKLTNAGAKIILQTIPPFDYNGDKINIWNNVNGYIIEELSKKIAFLFDCTKILSKSEKEPHMAKYGGHPNECGCKLWAEALSDELLKSNCFES